MEQSETIAQVNKGAEYAETTEETIVAIQLHVAERVTGQMRGFVEAASSNCTLTFDEKNRGVWIRGKNTNTLSAWSNIRAAYVIQPGQEKPLVRTK